MSNTNSFNNNTSTNNNKVFRFVDGLMPYVLILFLVANFGINCWTLNRIYNIQSINNALQETVNRQQKIIDDQRAMKDQLNQVQINQAEGKTRSIILAGKLDSAIKKKK